MSLFSKISLLNKGSITALLCFIALPAHGMMGSIRKCAKSLSTVERVLATASALGAWYTTGELLLKSGHKPTGPGTAAFQQELSKKNDTIIKELFKKHGFDVELEYRPEKYSIGVIPRYPGEQKVTIFIPSQDRHAFDFGSITMCRGTSRVTYNDTHAHALTGHEVDHIIHDDRGEVHPHQSRLEEERADKNAAENRGGAEADFELLAHYSEDLAYYLEIHIPRQRAELAEFRPDLLPLMESNPQLIETTLDTSHPLLTRRVCYLRKQAEEYRRLHHIKLIKEMMLLSGLPQ